MSNRYSKIAGPMIRRRGKDGKPRKIASPAEVETALRAADAPDCVVQEWINEARRRLADRKPEKSKVQREFTHVHSVISPDRAIYHHWSYHPTKGYRRERISRTEALYFRKKFNIPIVKQNPLKREAL